jgi:hypothetical protein
VEYGEREHIANVTSRTNLSSLTQRAGAIHKLPQSAAAREGAGAATMGKPASGGTDRH